MSKRREDLRKLDRCHSIGKLHRTSRRSSSTPRWKRFIANPAKCGVGTLIGQSIALTRISQPPAKSFVSPHKRKYNHAAAKTSTIKATTWACAGNANPRFGYGSREERIRRLCRSFWLVCDAPRHSFNIPPYSKWDCHVC